MTSNFDEMEFEYLKVKNFIETQAGVKFARRCLMACVTGIEFLNKMEVANNFFRAVEFRQKARNRKCRVQQ